MNWIDYLMNCVPLLSWVNFIRYMTNVEQIILLKEIPTILILDDQMTDIYLLNQHVAPPIRYNLFYTY